MSSFNYGLSTILNGRHQQEWQESLEFDNWGNPLPTASAATVAAWKASKKDDKMKELSNTATYPYADDAVTVK